MLSKASVAATVASVATLLAANGALAFSNTSPHLFFANANNLQHADAHYADTAAQRQESADSAFVVQSSEFDQAVLAAVADCPADAYLFVNIPGLHSSDLANANNLRDLYDNSPEKFAYSYVSSRTKSADAKLVLAKEVASKCNADQVSVDTIDKSFTPFVDASPRVFTLEFEALPVASASGSDSDATEARKAALQDDLEFLLSTVVQSLPSPNYVVILSSSPVEVGAFSNKYSRKASTDKSKKKKRAHGNSLFDNYKFFGAGIFEGSLVALFLIYTLYNALAWLSDLKITYKSFEKDPSQSTKAQ